MDDIPYQSMNTAARERHWQRLLQRWQAGGLSRKAFCDQEKISRSTLTYWRKRLQHQTSSPEATSCPSALALTPPSPGFVEVRLTEPEPFPIHRGGYDVRLRGGRSVHLPTGFDGHEVERLVRLLEALC